MSNNTIMLRTGKAWLDENQIIRVEITPNMKGVVDDARELVDAVRAFGQGRTMPVFIDLTTVMPVDADIRAYYTEHGAKVCHAAALLVSSPISRVVGAFFLGFNNPGLPIKLFTKQEEALSWLKTVPAH